MDLKKRLEEYFQTHPYKKFYAREMKRLNPQLFDEVKKIKLNIPENKNIITEKIYFILNGLTERPKCKTCGKNYVTFDSSVFSYRRFCCSSCGQLDSEVRNSYEKSCLEKYGVKFPSKCKTILEKIKKTSFEKYGGWYLSSNDCKEKSIECNLKKYGVKFASQSDIVKEKSRQTCLKRYGAKYSFQSENNKEKTKQTCLKKYGVEKIGQSKIIREKIHKTNFEKYNVSMPLQNYEIYNKTYNSIATETYNRLFNDDNFQPLFSFDEFIKSKKENIKLKWKCKKCGNIFFSFLDGNSFARYGTVVRCYNCNPRIGGKSKSEEEKFDFVKILDKNVISGTKKILPKNLQIDIFCEDKKLAIEFDGLYWHSEENNKDKNYHLFKTNECEKIGIQLIHIFEDEWLYKQNIVKSYLKNLFGVYDKKIFAEQCEVREISQYESFEFQKINHIKEAVNSKINLGLFYKNELVSVMTFSKPHFDKNHDWELVRFCNKLDYNISNAVSKLFSFFEKAYKPKSIIGYVDRRWSQGDIYKNLGFTM